MTLRLLALCLLAGCATPLTHKIKLGQESFVIGVGEGPDAMTDLFAAPAGGGVFSRLTFNRAEERYPRIAPDGGSVAFLRRGIGSGGTWSLVFLSLYTNEEHSIALPGDAGAPERLGWDSAGTTVVVSAQGYFAAAAPPALPAIRRLSADSAAVGDSLTRELLGDPPQGMVRECMNGGLCVVATSGALTLLDSLATDAVRWGADSVGYFLPGAFEVRPLGGGRSRRPSWSDRPAGLRQLSYHGELK